MGGSCSIDQRSLKGCVGSGCHSSETAARSVFLNTEGRVEFEDAPGERGTRVTAIIAYDPPAGTFGRTVAKLFMREPEVQARHDLRRFKMLMEAGEISAAPILETGPLLDAIDSRKAEITDS